MRHAWKQKGVNLRRSCKNLVWPFMQWLVTDWSLNIRKHCPKEGKPLHSSLYHALTGSSVYLCWVSCIYGTLFLKVIYQNLDFLPICPWCGNFVTTTLPLQTKYMFSLRYVSHQCWSPDYKSIFILRLLKTRETPCLIKIMKSVYSGSILFTWHVMVLQKQINLHLDQAMLLHPSWQHQQ